MRYNYKDSYGYMYVKSSYTSFSKSSFKVVIAFIVIGSVAFVGIIITIIIYYCRKKLVDSYGNVPNRSDVVEPAPPAYPSEV